MKLIFAFALIIVVAAASKCSDDDGKEALNLAQEVSIKNKKFLKKMS
jgi:hypothetical protein